MGYFPHAARKSVKKMGLIGLEFVKGLTDLTLIDYTIGRMKTQNVKKLFLKKILYTTQHMGGE